MKKSKFVIYMSLLLCLTGMTFISGCASLLDPKKDIAIVEDIIDDVVVEETGVQLNLGPDSSKK